MVTKQEFKELTEKYNTEKYGRSIIITVFNGKLVILNPYYSTNAELYNYSDNKAFKHHIIEYDDTPVFYGVNGKVIKGSFEYFNSTNVIYEGDDFLINLGKLFTANSYTYSVQNIPHYYKNRHFRNLINDLISADIKINGLFRLIQYYNRFSDFNYISLEKTFHIKVRDLRVYTNWTSDIQSTDISYINLIKKAFSCSIEEAISYLPTVRCIGFPFNNTMSKIERKQLKCYINCAKKINETDYNFLTWYRDYYRMAKELNNSIDTSFPLYLTNIDKLKKLHNEVIIVYNREQARISAAKNKLKQENYEKLFYNKAKELEYSDKTYSIIACKELSDLIVEGSTLHHCVGSYINSVSEGREFILFLRKNDELDTPFYTIDVSGDNVRQIHGDRNCNITKELKPFIREWADKFNLSLTNCNGVYYALR